MARIKERLAEIKEALGEKRYVLADTAKTLAAVAAFLYLYFYGATMTTATQIALAVVIILVMLIWFMAEHAVRLRKRLTPTLIVMYDDKSPDCHKTVHVSGDRGTTFHRGQSIRLRVMCSSDVTVEQCSGFLTKIEYRTHGGSFSEIPLYEPACLHWAMEEPTPFNPVTVYPRINRYLGICRTDENEQGFKIRLKHRSFVTPESYQELGEYKFHIEIVAARSPTISKILLITWNGNWNEIKACLVENT